MRPINSYLVGCSPLFTQDPLVLWTADSDCFNQTIKIVDSIQHLNGLTFDRAPGTNPSVEKSTGMIVPFSSFARSRLNPHNSRARFRKMLRSATCNPGQIRLPPPKLKWSRLEMSG